MERRVDVMRAVAIIGFIIALALAVFAFTQQQQAQENARLAQAEAAEAQEARVTAVAMAQEASGTQVQAEADRVTAIAEVGQAGTAQAEAERERETAVAQAEVAGTQAAEIAATSMVAIGDAQGTLQVEVDSRATDQAQSEAALATAGAQLDEQATIQADTMSQLSTITAQIDLADFARESAEEDRLVALEQAWVAATALANAQMALETAQSVSIGVTATPPPIPPPATATLAVPPTTLPAVNEIPPLTSQYIATNRRVTFNYPLGWEAVELENGIILVADNESTLQRQNTALVSGQFEVTLLVNPVTNIRGVEPGATSSDVMNALLGFFSEQTPPPEFDAPVDLEIGDFAATRVLGHDEENQMSITTVDLGEGIGAVVFAYSLEGEMEFFLEAVDGIIASLVYGG